MMKRIFVSSILCFYISAGLFGQKINFDFSSNSISNRLKTDIYTLASDSFMGREAGTNGELLARDYIVAKFKEAGIIPLKSDSSFIQPFKIKQSLVCQDFNNFFTVNNVKYSLNRDYSVVTYSSNDSIKGELIYLNFGITAPSLNYDDYKGKTNLENRVFVIELSIPNGYKKNSKFIPYSSMSAKIDLAISKGAKGIVFINSDQNFPYEPVKLLPGFKKYPIPIIYYKKKLEDLISTTTIPSRATIKTKIESDNSGLAYNVVGYINNNAPLSVVIGGHYDHLGFGGKNSLSRSTNHIHSGTDDNASGTAAVIELARYLKVSDCKKYNYIFITFSGEEIDLLGSEFFVKSPEFQKCNINYMINLDMIGRLNNTTKKVEVWASGSSRKWETFLKTESTIKFNFKLVKGSLRDSDHYPFYQHKIPTLFFITGLHPDYHKISDLPNKINYKGEADIILYLENLIKVLDSQEKVIYKKTGIIANIRANFYTIGQFASNFNK